VAAFGFHDLGHQSVTGAGKDVVEQALEPGAVFDGLEFPVIEAQSFLDHRSDLLFVHGKSSFQKVILPRESGKAHPRMSNGWLRGAQKSEKIKRIG
jgi:hypothetical protein